MFAGTGGLADYNMPEDVNFRGVELLHTPSPAACHKHQSPPSGMSSPAAALALSAGSLGGFSPGTPDRKVQLSSSPAPTARRGIAPLLARDGSEPGAAPAAPGLVGHVSSPGEAVAEAGPAKGRGRGGRSRKDSLAAVEETLAEPEKEPEPKQRGRRSGRVISCPAREAEAAEAVAEEAGAAVAGVQPKTRARARRSQSTSSPAIVAEEAVAEEVEGPPEKRRRRSGHATSQPAEEAETVEAVAEEAEATAAEVRPKSRARVKHSPLTSSPAIVAEGAEAIVAEGAEAEEVAGEDISQHVDWEAVRKLKTFAGRYPPNSQAGLGTWVTRRALFYSQVPQEYQTTKLQLSFWKYLGDKVQGAQMSESEAARHFVQEGRAGAAAE